MKEVDTLVSKKAILDYWTLVEFFSPYQLDNLLQQKQSIQKLYVEEPEKEPLPWLNAPIIREDDPTNPFTKGYHLFLGIFNIEETADKARHIFGQQPSDWQSVKWRNCGAASSTTCFARLTVTTHGAPLLGTLTLSTLPWAHGRLLNGQVKYLTVEEYWKSVNKLLETLREEFSRQLPKRVVKQPKIEAKYLDAKTLIEFTGFLYQWAGYQPQGYPIALIEPLFGDHIVAAKEPHIKSVRDVPILNSFYIQDLEATAISLRSQTGKPIDHYLSDNHDKRILLESKEGAKAILDTLRPEKIPHGRWPSPPSHQQSLMQQFAINAVFDSSKIKDIFSVNGPPGTGKTSLLREIIAQNIVARAEALSTFKRAKDVFTRKQALHFEGCDPIFVSELDPSLLGYEMVVVSSNNTAVQNLSKELPLRSQLDPSFWKASYLESVVTKVLGLKEKEAWGMVSATLGNMDNCRHFVDSVFIKVSETKSEARIWEWIEAYQGPSFYEAKEAFLTIKQDLESLIEELEYLAYLHDELHNHILETYCAKEFEELVDAEKESERLLLRLSQLLQEEKEAQELLILHQEREMLWQLERPTAIARIFNRKVAETWSNTLKIYRKEHLATIEELQKNKRLLKELHNLIAEKNNRENDLGEKLLDRAFLFHLYQESYHQLKEQHPRARLPGRIQELEEVDSQTQSYYQTEELNSKRTQLFLAAMTLHEAWLAETSQIKGGFRGNLMAIATILQGKSPSTADDTRLAWQSVFLLVPVISSTFASIGRLFRYLEPGSLGWVLIDEAGQSLPQAAVGAIWRAQNVLSIGDPFQIEPICTIAPEVIDGMAKIKIKDFTLSWAPSQVSVQNLMDRASVFCSKRMIDEQIHWLGSPLRVHRRCLDPMFTIANTIAYEKSMLLATQPCKELSLPPSCWWDVGGLANHKQFVPEQGKALIPLLINSLGKMNAPDFYIISPFREVIDQIQHLLLENKALSELFEKEFPKIAIQAWVRESIGTVHMFQGKQATAVFFVLGGDRSTLGAIEWASRKPNLLNVAVTRAQSRFYVIGDYDLWKTRPYFEVAAKQLKRCSYP